MKKSADISNSQKIYNCVDDLLMEDIDFSTGVTHTTENKQNISKKNNRLKRSSDSYTQRLKQSKRNNLNIDLNINDSNNKLSSIVNSDRNYKIKNLSSKVIQNQGKQSKSHRQELNSKRQSKDQKILFEKLKNSPLLLKKNNSENQNSSFKPQQPQNNHWGIHLEGQNQPNLTVSHQLHSHKQNRYFKLQVKEDFIKEDFLQQYDPSNKLLNLIMPKTNKPQTSKIIRNLSSDQSSFQVKKTYSYEIQDEIQDETNQGAEKQEIDKTRDKGTEKLLYTKKMLKNHQQEQRDEGSPSLLLRSDLQNTREDKEKTNSIQTYGFEEIYDQTNKKFMKVQKKYTKTPLKSSSQPSHSQNVQPSSNQKGFHLSREQIEFLSLLYPQEQPKQLMLKLLSYYELQEQYRNSLLQLIQQDKYLKSIQKIGQRTIITANDSQNNNKQQLCRNSIQDRTQSIYDDSDQYQDQEKMFVSEKYNPNQMANSPLKQTKNKLKQYKKLKQECLAALGSQMVQTQIKNTTVQTANINYYTRQYAMPQIIEIIQEKNQQSKQKMESYTQNYCSHSYRNSPGDKNLQKAQNRANNLFNEELQKQKNTFQVRQEDRKRSFFSSPQSFIHKIYIPANTRGQCFEMDAEPGGKLFDFLPENDYRRILRDINHLIQKVLLYHRHSSFLKKKNNYLFQGWNLALLIFLMASLTLLYLQSLMVIETQTSYIEVVSFFCLSFIIILILGNSFNNYKKDVKRSSLIKDVCEQINNYLEFINCSNKNIKWILGKDFFWLEIWITVRLQAMQKG